MVSCVIICTLFCAWCLTPSESKTGNVTLQLDCSNKSVLDSNVTFGARLLAPNGTILDKSLYIYEWNDNITDPTNTTNHTVSELQKIYRDSWLEGGHWMNVTVYHKARFSNKVKGPPVATGKRLFFLTDTLNVDLQLHQTLPTAKQKSNIFASGIPIFVVANITDKIDIIKSSFLWQVNDSSTVNVTSVPRFKVLFNKSLDFTFIKVISNTNCSVNDPNTGKITVKKSGQMTSYITIKDQVLRIFYSGDVSLFEGDLLTLNISCDGSPPFNICSSVNKEPLHPTNCSQFVTKNGSCWTQLTQNMSEAGDYTVTMVVKNSVSVKSQFIKVVISPLDDIHPSGWVAVACVFISIVVVILMLHAYNKARRKRGPRLETADWDFHHFQTYLPQSTRWDRVREKVASWLPRRRRDNSEPTVQVRYGAIDQFADETL